MAENRILSNAFEVEKERQAVLKRIQSNASPRRRLFIFNDYFTLLLSNGNPLVAEAWLPEFIDDFVQELRRYDARCLPPQRSGQLPETLTRLGEVPVLQPYFPDLQAAQQKMQEQQWRLTAALTSEAITTPDERLLSFPVIEETNDGPAFAYLETVTIRVLKARRGDRFVLIPAAEKMNNPLQRQIRDSWQAALHYVRIQHRHLRPHHEVIIEFEQPGAQYSGNSLGIALTIGFIEQLLAFYNTPYQMRIGSRITSTGSMEGDGAIRAVSDKIIAQKTRAVFYSDISTFIIPEADLPAAREELSALQREYPNRRLELAGVKDLRDLLDRRSLIEIKKQSPLQRAVKSAKQRPTASVLLFMVIILAAITGAFVFREIDTNPAILENIGALLTVKNKAGKVLWTKPYNYANQGENSRKSMFRLMDVDADGRNEAMVCGEPASSLMDANDAGRLACFDARGKLIWKYLFRDSIRSSSESFENIFHINMIDTVTVGQQKQLLVHVKHVRWYPSAVFRLDLRTGRRLPGTLWNSGHFQTGLIKNIPGSAEKELIITGFNNAWDKLILLSINLKDLDGAAPATEHYRFTGKNPARLRNYILLPVSDLATFYDLESNNFCRDGLHNEECENQISVATRETKFEDGAVIGYCFDYYLKPTRLVIGNPFIFRRDKLVREGKLSPPLSETKEYHKLLMDEIRFWDGEKFVNSTEYFRMQSSAHALR